MRKNIYDSKMNNEFNSEFNPLSAFENHFLQVVDIEMDFLSNEMDFGSNENMTKFEFFTDQTNNQTNESIESSENDEIPQDVLFDKVDTISNLFQIMRKTEESVSTSYL